MLGAKYSHKFPWQVKRVNSTTGAYDGTYMSDAITQTGSVEGQTVQLWTADSVDSKFHWLTHF